MRYLTSILALSVLLPLQSTLKVDVNLVSIFATVHDEFGNFVTDLDQDDFRLFEDGPALAYRDLREEGRSRYERGGSDRQQRQFRRCPRLDQVWR